MSLDPLTRRQSRKNNGYAARQDASDSASYPAHRPAGYGANPPSQPSANYGATAGANEAPLHGALFSALTQGVVYQEAQRGIVAANAAAERILGLTFGQMQGRLPTDPRWRAIHEDGTPFAAAEHPTSIALRTGRPVRNVIMGVFHPAANAYRWLQVMAIPQFRPGSPAPVAVYTVFDDITTQRTTAQALDATHDQLRSLLESVTDAIFTLDTNWRFTYINEEAERLLRQTSAELVGIPIWRAFPEQADGPFNQAFQQARKTQRPIAIEAEYTPLATWFEARVYPSAAGITVFFTDITARKQVDEALRESERRFRAIFEQAPIGVALIALDGAWMQANRRLCEMLGYARAELMRLPLQRLIHPDDPGASLHALSALASGAQADYADELRCVRKDGSLLWARLHISVTRDDDEQARYLTLMLEDITEQKRAEAALRHSERQSLAQARELESIFEAVTDGLFVYDATGHLTRVNRAGQALMLTGEFAPEPTAKVSERIGRYSLRDETGQLLPDDRWPICRLLAGETLAGPTAADIRMRVAHGQEAQMSVSGAPIRDAEQRIVGVVALMRDVTERRRLERRTHDTLRALLMMAEALVTTPTDETRLAPHAEIARAGVGLETPLDAPTSDVIKRLVALTRHVLERPHVAIATLNPGTNELQLVGGGEIDGETDVQAQGETTLPQSQRAHDDPHNHWQFVATTLDELFTSTERNRLASGENVTLAPTADRPQEALAIPLRIREQLIGVLWLTRDAEQPDGAEDTRAELALALAVAQLAALVIEREQHEAELRRLSYAALEASRQKSEFLANMSHELRTPMGGVISMSELLLTTPLAEEQQDYARIIHHSAQALLNILNEILDFSKIEAGKLTLEYAPFDPCALVEDVAELFAPRAHEKGIELTAFVDPDVPALLSGDAGRLRQTLLNLVGNAIKFTAQGEVAVRMTLADPSRAPAATGDPRIPCATIRIEVCDTGIGMTPDVQARIFQPFVQADGSTSRTYGGTGLGLAICKRQLELMGGAIGVQSDEGRGSTFWCTIPLPVVLSAEAALLGVQPPDGGAPHTIAQGARALVANGNDLQRRHLVRYLQVWGVRADEAASGQAALDALEAAQQAGAPYQCALIDLALPDMDGFAFLRAARRRQLSAGVSLLLVTAFGQAEEGAEALEAGFTAYLAKPLKRNTLLDILRRTLPAPIVAPATEALAPTPAPSLMLGVASHAGGTPNATAPSAPPTKILLVEDNPINQRIILSQLNHCGYTADTVGDGRAAIPALTSGRYALALMDCQMPIMDGYEATGHVRAHEAQHGGHTPIIALTAHALQGDRDRCLKAGMDDYLTKPVNLQTLKETITRWLATLPTTPPPDTPMPTDAPNDNAEDATGDTTATSPSLDYGVLTALQYEMDCDDEMFAELLASYQREAARGMGELRTALANGDLPALQSNAHRLKSSSASVGALPLSRCCAEIERLAGGALAGGALADESLARIGALVAHADDELARVAGALAQPGDTLATYATPA